MRALTVSVYRFGGTVKMFARRRKEAFTAIDV